MMTKVLEVTSLVHLSISLSLTRANLHVVFHYPALSPTPLFCNKHVKSAK